MGHAHQVLHPRLGRCQQMDTRPARRDQRFTEACDMTVLRIFVLALGIIALAVGPALAKGGGGGGGGCGGGGAAAGGNGGGNGGGQGGGHGNGVAAGQNDTDGGGSSHTVGAGRGTAITAP